MGQPLCCSAISKEQKIRVAAAAIANARGARRGVPEIVNILSLIPRKLVEEVTDDATAAVEAIDRLEQSALQQGTSADVPPQATTKTAEVQK